MRVSRFQRGSGSAVFTCHVCGRKTRDTGDQAVGSRLCPQCWDLAGIENAISDRETTRDAEMAHIRATLATIAGKNGNVAEWVKTFGICGCGATGCVHCDPAFQE